MISVENKEKQVYRLIFRVQRGVGERVKRVCQNFSNLVLF